MAFSVMKGAAQKGTTRPHEYNADFRKRVIRTNLGMTPTVAPDYFSRINAATHSLSKETVGKIPPKENFSQTTQRWVNNGMELYSAIKQTGADNASVMSMDFEYYTTNSYDGKYFKI